jgi:protein-disulfide isomerase
MRIMKPWLSCALGVAGLYLAAACVLFAQDWKTAASLPGVSLSELSDVQKATVLKILREHGCSCACNMKLAECRVVDPSCSYSKGLAQAVVDAVKQGKNEADAVAALNASHWAHAQEPKILDDPVSIPIAGAPFTGARDAPITLVEFSDFQCPYCAAAVPEIRAILKAYPTQVKLVFKEFPLEMHSQANLAAAAAVSAHKQGKFWAMHDAMYAERGNLSRDNILALARKSGLDMNRFQADLVSSEVRETIIRDLEDGDRAGVEGTPTIFINGQRYNGPILLDSLKPILDAELKEVQPVKQAASLNR